MADLSPFSTSVIHHIALRVEDVEAGKNWLATVLGFRVQRELQLGGNNVVFLSPNGADAPIIDLIGGPVDQRQLPDNIPDILRLSGWHHLCLQVRNLEECMADLRHRDVKILIDVMDGNRRGKNRFHRRPLGKHLRVASSRRRRESNGSPMSWFGMMRATRAGGASRKCELSVAVATSPYRPQARACPGL